MEVKTFIVGGMSCKNCKGHVERSIKEIAGIDDVIADISNGQVRVSGKDIDDKKIKHAVEEAGYQFKGEASNAAKGSDLWFS